MGHGNRDQCVDFIKQEDRNWNSIKILIFDAPQETDVPYSKRLKLLEQRTFYCFPNWTLIGISKDHPILSLVKPTKCESEYHLESIFNTMCVEQPPEKRAEGIVLRDPNAWYFMPGSFLTKKVSVYKSNLIVLGFWRGYRYEARLWSILMVSKLVYND
jgi:hypothetical protein